MQAVFESFEDWYSQNSVKYWELRDKQQILLDVFERIDTSAVYRVAADDYFCQHIERCEVLTESARKLCVLAGEQRIGLLRGEIDNLREFEPSTFRAQDWNDPIEKPNEIGIVWGEYVALHLEGSLSVAHCFLEEMRKEAIFYLKSDLADSGFWKQSGF